MKRQKMLIVRTVLTCALLLLAMPASAGEGGSLLILPDMFSLYPDGESVACRHSFGTPTALDTVTIDLDEYFHCYMEITVHGKTCGKCGVTAYDLDYELFPHEGNEMFCKRCGKHLTPPVIVTPLDE